MRDAATLETRGVPCVILVNDIFEPIAHATAALLDLPADYVARHVIWLPHPTSTLTPAAAAALIDKRIDTIRAAFLGETRVTTNAHARNGAHDPLALAQTAVAGFAASLKSDGAELVLERYDDGVLGGVVRIGELTCDDGSCLMPTPQLAQMIAALVRPTIPALHDVILREEHV